MGPEIYHQYDLANRLNLSNWHVDAVAVSLSKGALGVFPMLLTEYGVFGVIFVIAVFSLVWRSNVHHRYPIIALMFLTWLQSFPAAYPLFWFLIGLSRNKEFQKPGVLKVVSVNPKEAGQGLGYREFPPAR